MTILFFALFLLAFGLVFCGLNRLYRKLAYPLGQRYLHCRTIPAVLLVLLAAANVYTLSYPLEFLDGIINSPALSSFFSLVLPNRAYELVYMLLVHLGLNLMVFLLVMAAAGLVRLLFRRRSSFVDIEEYYGVTRFFHLPWLFAGKFYDENDGVYRLNGKGFAMGIWAGGLKWSFGILWIAELAVLACSILWGSDSWNDTMQIVAKNTYLLPIAGFLLLQEVQFLLEDVSEEEAGSFRSASISETHDASHVSTLMDYYRQSFSRSDALLVSDFREKQAIAQEGLGSNDLGNQQIRDCLQPDVLLVITKQIRQCRKKQSTSYQNALVELLNGRSVNICDQCEGEFLLYLCAYLNYHMSQGKTALMLCRDRKRADQLFKALNQEMQCLNNLYSIWNIRTLEEAEVNSRMSMLVCSVDDFLHHRLFEKRQDFIGDLFCTVFADSIDLFSGNRLCIEQLFGVLRSIDGLNQYIAFSEVNNDSLRTAMEQAVKQEFVPCSNDTVQHPRSGTMVWRGESSCRLQQQLGIGTAMTPYMGTALPLALVAVKFDFPRVYVISNNAPGIFSFNDVLNMSAADISRYTSKDPNLKSQIRFQLDEALQTQDLSITVVSDAACNFLNTLKLWQKYRGTQGSVLHIISPPYALREYFADNFHSKQLAQKSNIFDALISNHLGTKISHMAVLLVALCDKGMTEKELMRKSREYQWEYENVDQLLQDCLKVVLTHQEIHSVYECFHFEEEKIFREDLAEFEVQTRITLIDSTIRRRLRSVSGHAALISKNDQRQTLPILCGNVYNYCLRHQIIPVGGYLYQIHAISPDGIHAEQVLPQDLPEYFQISDFVFDNYRLVDHCVDTGVLDLNLCTADVTRNIYGYLSCSQGNAFAGGNLMVSHIGQCIQTRMDCVNILELSVRKSEFGGKAVETMRLFAYLLKDFAKTLFPVTHQNLYTVLSEGTEENLAEQVLTSGSDASLDDLVCSLIPCVRNAPSADPDRITVYIVEFSCVEFGMVQMLYSRYQNILLMMREYLSWYLTPESDAAYAGVKGRYLHFGSGSVPEVLAPEVLLDFCRKNTAETDDSIEAIQISMDSNMPRCTFCHRPSMSPKVLGDDRRMCAHCKDHQLSQKDEIKSLFTETLRYMTEGYSISLPGNLHVRFQSADAIRRATGNEPGGRVLGFYNYRSRQLWLEARGPKIAIQSTLIHELTHAWQFHDPDFQRILPRVLRKFPKDKRDEIRLLLLEGHAVFLEVETMRRLNEEAYADRLHTISMQRSDVYGVGYRLLRDYILEKNDLGSHMTPFSSMNQLLDDILNGTVTLP